MVGAIFQILLFWGITIYFTQDHNLDWKNLLVWILFAHVAGYGTIVLVDMVINEYAALFSGLFVIISILYLVLTYKIYIREKKTKIKIIATYFILTIVVNFIIQNLLNQELFNRW